MDLALLGRAAAAAGEVGGPGAGGACGWPSLCWGERPRRRASSAVEARSPGCCAQRSGVSGVLFIRWRGAAAAARGADLNKVELPGLISFSRIAVGAGAD